MKAVSEREFMRTVIEFANVLGWLVYHVHDSRRSVAGFPDLLMLRRDRQVVAELKIGKKMPTREQVAWLDAFELAGVPAYVWRPSDWPEIERALR